MGKGCALVIGLYMLAIGIYIFLGWILTIILAVFGVTIATWQGALIVWFVSVIANMFKD